MTLALSVPAAGQGRLVEAARRHDAAVVRSLVAARASVGEADRAGMTALHWAVHHDDLALVELLLGAGAAVNAANRYSVTPLGIACLNGSAPIVRTLLAAGADVNLTQAEGESALMIAARTGSVEVVGQLLGRGAQVNAKEAWKGQTALMWAAAEGHAPVVKLLLAHGADIAARSAPPAVAAPRRATPAKPLREPLGFTALIFAVRGGYIDVVRQLVTAGADVNDQTPAGNALLHLAIMNAHYELAGVLLELGADPNVVSVDRLTPLHHVIHTRRPPWRTLPPPVPTGHLDSIDLMKRLIARGANVNATLGPTDARRRATDDENIPPPPGGATPLWLAATGPDVEAMKLLLANGADPAMRSDEGATPLVAAAGIEYRQGYRPKLEAETFEAVKLLLDLGADVHATDAMGNTALHAAAIRGVNGVVNLLLAGGANLGARNKNGKRAVDLAEDASDARSQPETAALLRKLMSERTTPQRD